MIAIDTNLLVHAHQREADLHASARTVLRRLAESPAPWAICYQSLIEFYMDRGSRLQPLPGAANQQSAGRIGGHGQVQQLVGRDHIPSSRRMGSSRLRRGSRAQCASVAHQQDAGLLRRIEKSLADAALQLEQTSGTNVPTVETARLTGDEVAAFRR